MLRTQGKKMCRLLVQPNQEKEVHSETIMLDCIPEIAEAGRTLPQTLYEEYCLPFHLREHCCFMQREQREMSSIRVSRAPWAGGTWERSEVQLQVVCWCTSASLNIGKFKPESCGGRNTELEDRPLFSHIPTAWLWGKKLRFSLPYL